MRPLLILAFAAALQLPAESLQFNPVTREVLEKSITLAVRDNAQRGAQLRHLFDQNGCSGEFLTEQVVSKKRPPNIICRLPGETPSTIIVGAHFDAFGSDGYADNWSGSALLPALYTALKGVPRKHTYLFVGFTDEESGLKGSRHFVKKMSKEDIADAHAMVNLDTLGMSPLNVWASRADPDLLKHLRMVAAALRMPLNGVNVEQVGTTDSESFAPVRVRRISVSSITQENWRILHSPMDRLERINADEYYNSYRLLAAFLAHLDAKLTTR
ncbi:MAG TPA: M28 family peptidase [Bryobacteraceae bacterium]|nr:M28 family peptidase [Bryobacteraceae bacterium]